MAHLKKEKILKCISFSVAATQVKSTSKSFIEIALSYSKSSKQTMLT